MALFQLKDGKLDVEFVIEEVLLELEEEGIRVDEHELRKDISFCAVQGNSQRKQAIKRSFQIISLSFDSFYHWIIFGASFKIWKTNLRCISGILHFLAESTLKTYRNIISSL